MDLHEIIEGEHWVKVKLFEGEAWFEEGLRRNKSSDVELAYSESDVTELSPSTS